MVYFCDGSDLTGLPQGSLPIASRIFVELQIEVPYVKDKNYLLHKPAYTTVETSFAVRMDLFFF